DAVLVTFSPLHDAEPIGEVVARSLACSLHIASRYGSMTLDMSIAEAMRGQVTSEYQSGYQSGGAPTELRLHFAITAGDVSRVILGNPQSRLDYCIHGACDVIITAARLMGSSKKHRVMVVDEQTSENIKLTTATVDLGFVKVKGKEEQLHIFGIAWPKIDDKGDDVQPFFGYKNERKVLNTRFLAWLKNGERATFVIEAASGMGKTFLANTVIDNAKSNKVPVCLVQGTFHLRRP
ncbi:hypothetical protein HK101_004696, partial [Irineochytrium annulatum]